MLSTGRARGIAVCGCNICKGQSQCFCRGFPERRNLFLFTRDPGYPWIPGITRVEWPRESHMKSCGRLHVYLICNHSAISKLICFCLRQERATKWFYNWSPGLNFNKTGITFRARPVGAGLWSKFGREMTETGQNLNYSFSSLV